MLKLFWSHLIDTGIFEFLLRLAPLLMGYVLYVWYIKKREAHTQSAKGRILLQLKDKEAFLCEGFDEVGRTKSDIKVFLLRGEVSCGSLSLSDYLEIAGSSFSVVDISTLSEGEQESVSKISAKTPAFVTIESNNLESRTIRQKLKRESVLVFPIHH